MRTSPPSLLSVPASVISPPFVESLVNAAGKIPAHHHGARHSICYTERRVHGRVVQAGVRAAEGAQGLGCEWKLRVVCLSGCWCCEEEETEEEEDTSQDLKERDRNFERTEPGGGDICNFRAKTVWNLKVRLKAGVERASRSCASAVDDLLSGRDIKPFKSGPYTAPPGRLKWALQEVMGHEGEGSRHK
ncbi:hypothetical protein WMY93_015976 [Mugilogobius chulae]|uniref:Uncharacterized protein n=1 Tax=Mugilogobius chulae TaxID=88201 RepID=A0AAW0P1S2_9GOBI